MLTAWFRLQLRYNEALTSCRTLARSRKPLGDSGVIRNGRSLNPAVSTPSGGFLKCQWLGLEVCNSRQLGSVLTFYMRAMKRRPQLCPNCSRSMPLVRVSARDGTPSLNHFECRPCTLSLTEAADGDDSLNVLQT